MTGLLTRIAVLLDAAVETVINAAVDRIIAAWINAEDT